MYILDNEHTQRERERERDSVNIKRMYIYETIELVTSNLQLDESLVNEFFKFKFKVFLCNKHY